MYVYWSKTNIVFIQSERLTKYELIYIRIMQSIEDKDASDLPHKNVIILSFMLILSGIIQVSVSKEN